MSRAETLAETLGLHCPDRDRVALRRATQLVRRLEHYLLIVHGGMPTSVLDRAHIALLQEWLAAPEGPSRIEPMLNEAERLNGHAAGADTAQCISMDQELASTALKEVNRRQAEVVAQLNAELDRHDDPEAKAARDRARSRQIELGRRIGQGGER